MQNATRTTRNNVLGDVKIEHTIDEWIKSERDRQIMKRKLIDGITFEQLAEEFDMSVRGINYKVYKCKEILLKHI